MLPLCLSNFPVPSSVTYLRRFHPSSQPLIKFPGSSHRVFDKRNHLVLDYSNILFLISWSEMCFKNLALDHFFSCLLNFHLFFFSEDLVENLDEVCSSWNISSFEDSGDEPLSI